jgi:hypothetical protein
MMNSGNPVVVTYRYSMGRGSNPVKHQQGSRRSSSVFSWDNDYSNLEQVRPYLSAFERLKSAMAEAGQFPYNDSFKGRIPGIAESEREDTAIYLLQRLNREEKRQDQIAKLLDDGFVEAGRRPPGEVDYRGQGNGDYHQEKFASIIISNEHGTTRYESARLVWSRKLDGQPYVVMPKGKRTTGRLIETDSTVLVRR